MVTFTTLVPLDILMGENLTRRVYFIAFDLMELRKL